MVFKWLRGEFIDIIEWKQGNDQNDVMCWKYPRHDNEIKNGAKLIVREGQRALFVSMGTLPDGNVPEAVRIETPHGPSSTYVGDNFGPGTFTLETRNLPILSKLRGWKYGFESPFKADVYYINTRRFTSLKWGTSSPVMLRDPEFGPIRVRAFGTYAVQVTDPVSFLRELVSTNPSFETYDIASQLRSMIVTRFSNILGNASVPVLDMAGNLDNFSTFVKERIEPEFAEMGISVPIFLVENVSLPKEVEKMLDKRTSMGVLGNLDQYAKFQAATAMGDAAKNEGMGGGMAGMGVGMGAGAALGHQMAQSLQPGQQPPANTSGAPQTPGAPPPLPKPEWFAAIGGQQAGPFDLNGLREHVNGGKLTRDTLVWKQGMASWTRAEEVAELSPLFAAAPPPLPPPLPPQ
ncbi:MAG: SPFH domain-containing protein [Candidatus Sumerlaeia bacterium]|nr:SPFH domain-containing protein [Candidatus Sumerlaeia bacterium]